MANKSGLTNEEIKEALQKEYNRDNFLFIVRNFLVSDFKEEIREYKTDNRKSLFDKIEYFGESKTCKVSIFEVKLGKGNEKKRVGITQEMFGVLKKYAISNAIVAFVDNDEKHFRYSLLTAKYEIKDNKIVKTLSNPRRYSYSLGFECKTKTAFEYLINNGQAKTYEELVNKFSVEVVNKEFYNAISNLYMMLVGGERNGEEFKGSLKINSINDHNKFSEFAVRLIGRLIFCWFLKEKRSEAGVRLIPLELFEEKLIKKSANYYHDVIEPLFFELLNTDKKHRKDKFGKEKIYNQIPYLNGGLFNPYEDDYYKYDKINESGTYGVVTIKNEWFIELFKVFNLYNFTVDENTAYDIELSIDPEMLGRVFENLLNEINPETGETARKNTGSFYTPREIVDYMVDSSIFEYLKRKTKIEESVLLGIISYTSEENTKISNSEKEKLIEALYDVKTIDISCGSGAFPIGILQKIVYILEKIDEDAELWFKKITENVDAILKEEYKKKFKNKELNYLRKLKVIQNSIFGVDIQPIAVEIARLRCFLSLIIEEKVVDDEENRGIKPLPSLEFKFIIANSLKELPNKNDSLNLLEQSFEKDGDFIAQLKEVRDEYFIADSISKKDLINKFDNIQKKMFKFNQDVLRGATTEKFDALSHWEPFENEATKWFDPDWMFGVKDGFDIVIGNPPYGILNKKQNQQRSIVISDDEVEYYKNSAFYLPCKGRFVNMYSLFIVKAMSLLNKNGNMCYIFPLAFMGDLSASNLRKYLFKNYKINYIEAFPERDDEKRRVFEAVKMSVCILSCINEKDSNDNFRIRINDNKYVNIFNGYTKVTKGIINKIDPEHQTIPLVNAKDYIVLDKIIDNAVFLSKFSNCYEGEINVTSHKKYIKNDKKYDKLIRGAQVQKYKITNTVSQGEILFLDSKKYLLENKAEKTMHYKNRRIVMQGITGINEKYRLKMSIIEKGVFCANSSNYLLINEEYIYSILAILNSNLMNYYFKKLSTNSNVNGYEVEKLPIKINKKFISEITPIVKKLLEKKGDDEKIVTKIDKMVYELYGIDNEEAIMIENFINN